MPAKSFLALCCGEREAARRPQQRETVPTVARAASPADAAVPVSSYNPQECINCTKTAFSGTTICENCGRPLREEVVVGDLLAAAVDAFERPEDDKKPPKKTVAATGVLLAYDDRCRRHRDTKTLGSFLGRGHPERPERVAAIMARLQAAGLIQRFKRYKGREVTREELLAVHDKGLVAAVEKATQMAVVAAERDKTTWYGPLDAALETMEAADSKHIQDVYFCPATAACARLAAGSAAEVARRVVSGAARHGAAIIRPPGHHAESSVAMGFCYYNNAAVAARAAQAAGAARVLIMDWDVHHGNGTQSIFYDDPSVLYMSTHRYDHSCFYPGTGNTTETGSGPGVGFTVNVPWNRSGVRDADMLAAFRHVIVPLATEFRPDLVIVSAGFDAAEGDPLGGCLVSTAAFSHFAALLSGLAPTVLLLEGGYNLTATAAATEACLRVLLGEPPAPLPDGLLRGSDTAPPESSADPWVASRLEGVSESALESISQALGVQSQFWEAARKQRELVDSVLEVRRKERVELQRQMLRAQQQSADLTAAAAAVAAAVKQRQQQQQQQQQQQGSTAKPATSDLQPKPQPQPEPEPEPAS